VLHPLCAQLAGVPAAAFDPHIFWEIDLQPTATPSPTSLFLLIRRKNAERRRALLGEIKAHLKGTLWEEKLAGVIENLHQFAGSRLWALGFCGGRAGYPLTGQLESLPMRSAPTDIPIHKLFKRHVGQWIDTLAALRDGRYEMRIATNIEQKDVSAIGIEVYPRRGARSNPLLNEALFNLLSPMGVDENALHLTRQWASSDVFHPQPDEALGQIRKLNHIKIVFREGSIIGTKIYLADHTPRRLPASSPCQ
jgi:hypothetical protein